MTGIRIFLMLGLKDVLSYTERNRLLDEDTICRHETLQLERFTGAFGRVLQGSISFQLSRKQNYASLRNVRNAGVYYLVAYA